MLFLSLWIIAEGQDDKESGGIMEFEEDALTSTEPPKQLDIGVQERTLSGGELDDQASNSAIV